MIVEDGTGLEDANSYVNIEDYKTYWIDRNIDISNKSDIELQASLVLATQYIDNNYNFVGYKSSHKQSLEFPRYNAYTREGYRINGVPKKLIYAVNEAGYMSLNGTSLFASTQSDIKERTEDVGPIKTTYKYGDIPTGRITYQVIKIYLKDLLRNKSTKVRRY